MAFDGTQDVVSVRARAIFFSFLLLFFFSESERGKNSFFFFLGVHLPQKMKDGREEKRAHTQLTLTRSRFL
jgi:hypothetical protein